MSLAERLRARRDALLGSSRFRRWAAAFPLTRPIARRRSRELFDLCAGFVYSQTLLAVVRLGVLDLLADAPRGADEIAGRLGLSLERTERLLRAACAVRLVRPAGGGRFAPGRLGAPLVGNAELRAMVEHNALLYRDLADPVALLRGENAETELGHYWGYATSEAPTTMAPDAVADYSVLMATSMPLVADDVLAAYPMGRHRCLLDVGGGEGAFLELAGRRAPELRLMLFDLPAVAERATRRLARSGLGRRAEVHGGDFFGRPLPGGADLITLIRVLHDHDDAAAVELLRRCRAALPPGGRLLVAEPLDGEPGATRVGAAYFGFYLLAMGSGRPRSAREYASLLEASGFTRVRRLQTRMPVQVGVMLAHVSQS